MNKEQQALDELRALVHSELDGTRMLDEYLKHCDTLQELVDKAIPKKKIQTSKLTYICPCCLENDIKNFVYGNYCDECGQRLE